MAKRHIVLMVAALAVAACSNPPAERPEPLKVAAKVERAAPKLMTVTSAVPEAVTAFERARDLAENIRQAEAMEQCRVAIAADPDFALAHAYLGSFTPGSEGMAELDKAVMLAANHPEAEKALIESMAAERRGEDDVALELLRKAAAAAPDDWRVQLALGQRLNGRYMLDDAAQALGKAVKLNPNAGAAYNMLGYVDLARGKTDEAIAAFTKYAEVSPTEPNPHDSLAEALMMAGRHDEAEAAFQRAIATSATFYPAWEGIAQSRFFRGDWTGGREALAKAKESATRAVEKSETDFALAWSYAAEGKTVDAMKTLDALDKTAQEQGSHVTHAFVPVDRARFATISGKPADAMKHLDEAMARAAAASLPGGPMTSIRRSVLETRIDAEAKLGKAAEAKETLAKIEAEAATTPGNPRLQSMLAYARGQAAMAAKDPAGAVVYFAQCIPEDSYCHFEEAMARKASGDTAGAASTLQTLLSAHRREPAFLWVHTRATAESEASKPTATN